MKAPSQLYKYFTASGALRFLLAWRLRFTPPDVFNDPFELRPFIRLCAPSRARAMHEQAFERHIQESYYQTPELAAAGLSYDAFRVFAESRRDAVGDALEELIPIVEGMIRERMPAVWAENVGILCLTEDPANLLMWAHYADSHQGVCIAFNSDASCFNRRRSPEDEFGHLRRVDYSLVRPEIELASCENGLRDFLTKSIDWQYEHEWRMLMPLAAADATIASAPRSIALFDCPPEAVTEVIFGARAAPDLTDAIIASVARQPKASHIKVAKAALNERHYRVELASNLL